MWTRSLLKNNAKNALVGRYWSVMAACFIASLLGAEASICTLTFTGSNSANGGRQAENALQHNSFHIQSDVAVLVLVVSLLIFAAVIAYILFVSEPLTVGYRRYMMENRQGNAPLDTLFSGFRAPYGNQVRVLGFRLLYSALWSLLLVIPGIIKGYEYSMIPYLLAENPYMPKERAFELSKAMTDGEKWNMFVLALSFIPWNLLALITCGLSVFFMRPYQEATSAELYAALRAKVIAQGLVGDDELGGFARYDVPPTE